MADEVKALKGATVASSNRRPKRLAAHPGTVNFVPSEFNNLLEDQGVKVRVTPAVLCPNRTDLGDTNHVLDCPLCFGDEVIDLCEKSVETWASITGITLDKNMEVQGIWDIKDAKMTFQSGMRVYYWYKVEVLDFGSIFNQIMKKSNGAKDRLRYKKFDACEIPVHCVGKNGTIYRLNEDFTIDGFDLIWKTNTLGAGDLYSISYPILPTFRILELTHENRYYYMGFKQHEKTPIQMPQEAVVRLDYLMGRNKSGARIDNPDNP